MAGSVLARVATTVDATGFHWWYCVLGGVLELVETSSVILFYWEH